jgi:hypothetical protein
VGAAGAAPKGAFAVYRVAVVALSALVITAAAPSAFAEDRGARVDDSHHTDGAILKSEFLATVQAQGSVSSGAEKGAPSFIACRGPSPTSPVVEGCQATRQNTSSLTRSIDWSEVGPSTDDFARTDDAVRLVGARVVAIYRF